MHCLFILLSNAVRWATFRLSIIITSAASIVCSRGGGGGGGGGSDGLCLSKARVSPFHLIKLNCTIFGMH